MSATGNNEYLELIYKGKKVRVPVILLLILTKIKDKIKHKLDGVILITGDVGAGKSNMAKLLGGLHEWNFDRELSIKNFTWTIEGLISFTDEKGNETQVIIEDEFIQGGTGKDSISKIGNQLKVTFVTKRRKRHLYLLLIDEIQEYNKKVISRADYLINVMFRSRSYIRGEFEVFDKKELMKLYWSFKNGEIKYLSQHIRKNKQIFRFPNVENIFINENEYESEKIKQTKLNLEKVPDGKIIIETKWLDALELKKKGLSQVKIGNELGVSKTTIQDWLNKLATKGII